MPGATNQVPVTHVAPGNTNEPCQRIARDLSKQLGLPFRLTIKDVDPADIHYLLVVAFHPVYDYQLELHKIGDRCSPLVVNFLEGALAHREKFGGGRSQPLARALGLKRGKSPNIIDLTAGLGRDAFVIATLGCKVQMIERHLIIHQLLKDGIRRATLAKHTLFTSKHLSLHYGNSIKVLDTIPKCDQDVLYLDPMYPERTKSALVKKEMRILRQLVGDDLNIENLLSNAIKYAQHRVVVKRPKNAPPLTGLAPSYSIVSKNTRYDVYK
ncbi:MAG: class I SAM-dependent methyltransferase [Gammaproteobacteria bacterium]|nr:class I SAM-dependent methyltransferase [Gammaproteobacteria bacterium]